MEGGMAVGENRHGVMQRRDEEREKLFKDAGSRKTRSDL